MGLMPGMVTEGLLGETPKPPLATSNPGDDKGGEEEGIR